MGRKVLLAVAAVLVMGCAASDAAAAVAPVLAGSNKPYGAGFGRSRPKTIWLGGDESGLVCSIHWLSWGRSLAIGTGIGWWVGAHTSVSGGHPSPAVVVLSDLGPWHGRKAYRHFTWYFPTPLVHSHLKKLCV